MFTDMAIEELRGQIEHFCGLGDRVISGTSSRALRRAGRYRREDLFHLRAPYRTDQRCARRSSSATKSSSPKARRALITQYEVLKGNPPSTRSTRHLPSGVTGKRLAGLRSCMVRIAEAFFSEQNLASIPQARYGVKLVCIPQRGGKRTPRRQAYESRAAFKNGQRFRAGIEGRILGAVKRPRHEALSRRRTRTLRIVGRRRCARQQPHENRGTSVGSVASLTKSCLTDTQARFRHIRRAAAHRVLELKVCPATPSPQAQENHQSGACRCRPLLAF